MSAQLRITITFLVLLTFALLLNEWVSVIFVTSVGFLTLSLVSYGNESLRQFFRQLFLGRWE